MKINGTHYRSIAVNEDGWSVRIFDQQKLPWKLVHLKLETMDQAAHAIKEMQTRGAPMLAMTGAYGLCLALRENSSGENLQKSYDTLLATRPTAVNLRWALDEIMNAVKDVDEDDRIAVAYKRAAEMCDEDVEINRNIGLNGLKLLNKISAAKNGDTINIMTHCNAGWLATVDYGTISAPIYMAHDAGIKIHVWVSETRPRNQGASLTAYELKEHGVPHTVIPDNASGHLMQKGQVDIVLTGTDRVTRNGDTCNKIGTYMKAVAAKHNGVPMYIALPYPTIDYSMESGDLILIEERSAREVTHISGLAEGGAVREVRVTGSDAFNPGFDVTPAELITGYITERGILQQVCNGESDEPIYMKGAA